MEPSEEIEETRALMAIPEPQRSQYVKDVILSVIEAVKKIANQPKLQQAVKLKQIQKELEDKKPVILPSVLYTVKGGPKTFKCPHCQADLTINETDFRAFFIELMKELEKEFEKQKPE